MLGRKQRISNQDWLDAIRGIERSCSRSHINELTARTVAEIRQRCLGKKTAYAWSGGKDSIVLGDLCEKAGVNQSVLVVCDLEYPAFLQWVSENKPKGLEIVNTGQDLEWLSKHPEMLFPKKSDVAAKWFHIVQHRGQAIYYKKHALDMIILGRRKADGNFVGRGSNIYTNAQGVTRYSPISGWTHEEVLAYIHYNNLPMPLIYDWKNGYLCGTHQWAARQWTGTTENGWREVYDIDRSIVEKAARIIPSARDFLSKL